MFIIKDFTASDGQPQRFGQFVKPDTEPKTGRALWFVPGLGGSIKGGVPFFEHLLPQFDTIYGADLRSFGLNPTDAPLTAVDVIPQDLEAFYKEVIAPAGHTDLTLCGISMGGVLATVMAAEHPERYKRLLLLAPAFKPHPDSFKLTYVLKNVLGCMIHGRGFRTQLPYDTAAVTRNQEILDQWAPPTDLTAGFLLDVRTLTGRGMKKAGELSVPTMVVIPGADVVCCPDAMRAGFVRIPLSTPKLIKEYPDFFHDVLFEEGHSDIADDFVAWLNGQSRLAESTASEPTPAHS